MRFLRLFFPRQTNFPNTPFNKNIHLVQGLGEPVLVVDSLIESGRLLTDIWRIGLQAHLPRSFSPQKVLLLGLGGGSNAHLVRRLYPQAKITAVEIDPQMVEIAKKYFKINKIKNLQIVIADAEKFVNNLSSTVDNLQSKPYDLILVDCFEGKYIPKSLQTLNFAKKLYSLGRYILINRIWWNEHHLETVFFLRNLSKHFFYLKTHTQTNIVVSLV